MESPQSEKWIEWIEPFGPNDEPVYMRVPASTAIAVMCKIRAYDTDEHALEDFITIHWASILA